jgi:signal peptidase I
MSNWLKYAIAFALAFGLMLAMRTLAVSIHSVTGSALEPLYKNGDRLLINRCSYGLRIAGNGLLPYCRLLRQPVCRGDIVAFTAPSDSIDGLFIARCKAVPGDTLRSKNGITLVPGRVNCAERDYFWLEAVNHNNPADSRSFGLVSEQSIVGRVVTVLYNRKNTLLP